MFKYLLIGLVIYWVSRRIFRVADAVKRDSVPPQNEPKTTNPPNTKSTIDHSKGGEYVEYEEVE
jgi:hypothetical protein